MPSSIIVVVLLAALLHASWNALAKGRNGADPLVGTLAVALGSGVASLCALTAVGLPDVASLWCLVTSGVIHVVYFVLVGLSYRHADYSAVYPLMRGCAPLITTLAGGVILGEPLTAGLLAGVALLSGGVIGLGAHALMKGGLSRRALAAAGLNVAVIVSYTLVDGIGARLSGNPAGYVTATLVLSAIMLLPIVIALRGRAALADLRAHWRMGLLGGSMATVSYGVALWAMTQAPIGAVAAMRETAVLFSAAIGALLLGERFGPPRWVAAAAICTGLVLIRMG